MNGPKVLFEIPLFGGITVTETVVNTWFLILAIFLICKFLTSRLERVPKGRQVVAEKLVGMVDNLVEGSMGKRYMSFTPYIAALFSLSLFSSLSSLLGLRPPTADLNTTLSWALVTFAMVQINKIRCNGFGGYLKGFAEPVVVMLPLNIISEIANPISMAFRHFGNIAAGMVITSLLYGALASFSSLILGWIPVGFIATMPLLQLGIPAVLSIYFDLFTSFLQAFIFCMLTMVFVGMGSD